MIGSGILVDKTINALEGPDETILDYRADPVNMVDRTWSVLKLEDVHNRARSGSAFGPAAISTWVLVILFVLGSFYPSWIIYKQIKKCYSKCSNRTKDIDMKTVDSKWTMKKMEKAGEMGIDIPEETFTKPEFKPEWTPPFPPPRPMDHS